MFNKIPNSFLYGAPSMDTKHSLIGNNRIWLRKETKSSGPFGTENYEDNLRRFLLSYWELSYLEIRIAFGNFKDMH